MTTWLDFRCSIETAKKSNFSALDETKTDQAVWVQSCARDSVMLSGIFLERVRSSGEAMMVLPMYCKEHGWWQ